MPEHKISINIKEKGISTSKQQQQNTDMEHITNEGQQLTYESTKQNIC